jgi:uncharacterized cupredoxin-like copper-binding protein
MKYVIIAAMLMALGTGAAFAAGTHAGGHGNDKTTMAIGKAGKAGKVKRSVTIVMSEKDDGKMVFEPASLQVKEGETIRLKFENRGKQDHEFVMDVHGALMEHKALMEKFPEMEHADPNSIRLAPGAKGEIVWNFVNSGEFGFACLIPGHYDSGMKGDISVAH